MSLLAKSSLKGSCWIGGVGMVQKVGVRGYSHRVSAREAPTINSSLNPFLPPRRFNPNARLRRSFFYVPASEERKILKATKAGADCVCLDIEDGVAINKKQEAREGIRTYLTKERESAEPLFGKSEKAIRINAIGSSLEVDDLNAIHDLVDCFDTIVVPKVESNEQLSYVSHFLDTCEGTKGIQSRKIKIIAQIESARGLVNLREICQNQPRLDALVYSSEDLCADLGMTRTSDAKELLFSRSRVVTYAVAFGLQPIDMVCINFRDLEFLKNESEEGCRLGFTGKQVIHPDQISVVNTAFLPSPKAVEFAKKIIDANEKGQKEGKGAFDVDGIMVDMPLVKWAQNILAAVPKS